MNLARRIFLIMGPHKRGAEAGKTCSLLLELQGNGRERCLDLPSKAGQAAANISRKNFFRLLFAYVRFINELSDPLCMLCKCRSRFLKATGWG